MTRADYHLSWKRASSHVFDVRLSLSGLTEPSVRVAMPAWTPGSYDIQNYAKNLERLEAFADGARVSPAQLDKQTWEIPVEGARRVEVAYSVYANTLSCVHSQLDEEHAHVTGASVFLYPVGHTTDLPCTLTIECPRGWDIATGLEPAGRRGRYRAPSYDELIDCPIQMGRFHHGTFRVRGKAHHVVVRDFGRERKNLKRLTRDLRHVVEYFAGVMRGLPYRDYWFLFSCHPTRARSGALEHANSTHLTLPFFLDAEDPENYDTAVEVAAHEFFHLWNVKRIRPAGLGPFDYAREVYTKDLWIAEGLTDYYAGFALRRAGIWSHERYLKQLGRAIDEHFDTPGRARMSLASSSFNTWTLATWHAPRQEDETNFGNVFVNYYNKGALAGLLLDLELRKRSRGRRSLDDVFREMQRRHARTREGFAEGEFEEAAAKVARRDLAKWFADNVRGTKELPLRRALATHGIRLRFEEPTKDDDQWKRRAKVPGNYGFAVDVAGPYPVVKNVFPGSPADLAGLSRGDLILAVGGRRAGSGEWRELFRDRAEGKEVDVAFFRHDRLLVRKLRPPGRKRLVARLKKEERAPKDASRLRVKWLGKDVPGDEANAEGQRKRRASRRRKRASRRIRSSSDV